MRPPALYLIQFPTWMDVLLLHSLAWHKEERRWMPPQGKQDSPRRNRRQVTENMSHSLKPRPHLHSVYSGSFYFFQNIQGKSFSLWTFVATFLWLSKSDSKVFVMWSNIVCKFQSEPVRLWNLIRGSIVKKVTHNVVLWHPSWNNLSL